MTTMVTAQQATNSWATGDNDDDGNGTTSNCATGYDDDDGDRTTSDEVDDDGATQRAMARLDTTTTMMATGDNNDVDGATGDDDDDGDGATGDSVT